MASGIYSITCLINGKIYIGSTENFKERWKEHKYELRNNIHINRYLQRAWNKYGSEYFDWEILEECEIEELLEREQYYMNYTESYLRKNGYNISPTAGSQAGRKCYEETKKKLSIKNKGRKLKPFSQEQCNNISKSLIGHKTGNRYYRKRRFPDEWIKEIRASKLSDNKLAEEYSCSHWYIWEIKKGISYKDVK